MAAVRDRHRRGCDLQESGSTRQHASVATRLGVSPCRLYIRVGKKQDRSSTRSRTLCLAISRPRTGPEEPWGHVRVRLGARSPERGCVRRAPPVFLLWPSRRVRESSQPLVDRGGDDSVSDSAVQAFRLPDVDYRSGSVPSIKRSNPAFGSASARPGADPGGVTAPKGRGLFDCTSAT